ncbi:MAG: hypothetical protein J7562_09090 [Agrobacterium tumefaciens]|nr:hypothetical protein [Agrobacterium tumefaciens]
MEQTDSLVGPPCGHFSVDVSLDCDPPLVSSVAAPASKSTMKGIQMFEGLNLNELQQREDKILFDAMQRKWALDVAGFPPEEDKVLCFWKWQLREIEAAKTTAAA